MQNTPEEMKQVLQELTNEIYRWFLILNDNGISQRVAFSLIGNYMDELKKYIEDNLTSDKYIKQRFDQPSVKVQSEQDAADLATKKYLTSVGTHDRPDITAHDYNRGFLDGLAHKGFPPDVKGFSLQQVCDAWDACYDYVYEQKKYEFRHYKPTPPLPNKEQYLLSITPVPPQFDSAYLTSGSKERFRELHEKGHDWRSFYSGWIEGRIKMWENYRTCPAQVDVKEIAVAFAQWRDEEDVCEPDHQLKEKFDYWLTNIYPQSKK